MSRHSKWAKVKQFKGAIDAKRAASFTKLAREITVAAKEKGADPNMNARLRAAISRARESSMPKDAIDRAVQRGTSVATDGPWQIEALTYEAYAPGGTALVIECLTDSRNRASNEIKHSLSKNGGTLAAFGSVTYLFDHVGVVRLKKSPPYEGGVAKPRGLEPSGANLPLPLIRKEGSEDVELALIDAGASNIIDVDGTVEIHSAPHDLMKVANAATALGLQIESVEMEWIAKERIETSEADGTRAVELIELLEANDDVQRVFSNLA